MAGATITTNGRKNGDFYDLNVEHFLTVGGQNISTLLSGGEFSQIIGVKHSLLSSSPAGVWVDRLGNTITPTATFFSLHPVFGQIRRCNVNDAGVVTAYYGDPTFAVDGSNGQVMTEFPKYWYLVMIIGTDIYRWISPVAAPGFSVHPKFISDSVEYDHRYIGTFEASVFDVTTPTATESDTITITAGCSTSGNLTITVGGNYSFTVAVTAGQSAEDVAAAIRAAGNKTGYQGVLWTVGGSGATVTYTANSTGLKHAVQVAVASTGVTRSIVRTVVGAGGYVINDAAGYDMTATTGDKLCSIAGVKPATGWANATLTLPNFRVLAHNRGAGWELMNFNDICGVQLLYLIRYATFDSQTTVSAGATNITDDALTNMAINTGFTAGVGVGAVNLGNADGQVVVTHYQTGQTTHAFNLLGLENVYGNISTWLDGINIKADRNPWIADHDFASDTFAHPYVNTGLTLAATDGYPTALANVPALDYTFLPSAVDGTGSSSKWACDYYFQNTGNRIVRFGGPWNDGPFAGMFRFAMHGASSAVTTSIGARLARMGAA